MGDFIPQELESRLSHTTDVQIDSSSTTTISSSGNSSNINKADTSRQSNTPVVSLLSIDHQQEKDLTSMQSGRRRKSPSLTPPHNHNFIPNGFQSGYAAAQQPPRPHHPQPPNPYAQNMYQLTTHLPCLNPPPPIDFGYNPNPVAHKPSNNNRIVNGYDKTYSSRRKQRMSVNDRPQNCSDNNVVTIRSDSNSSASVVDENRNENKLVVTSENYHCSSSVPYYSAVTSTHSTNNNKVYNNNVRHNWSYNNNNNNNHNNNNRSGGNTQDKRYTKTYVPRRVYNSNNNNNTSPKDNLINYKSNVVPVSSEISNGIDLSKIIPHQNMNVPQMPSHFVPPSRRNRKTIRRNTSSTISEIGAGDAPLPVQDVNDAGKKLESLKL